MHSFILLTQNSNFLFYYFCVRSRPDDSVHGADDTARE